MAIGLRTTGTVPIKVSFDDLIRYLEDEFLSVLRSSTSVSSVTATPIQGKDVGTAELTRADDANLSKTDRALREMSRTLFSQLDSMLKQEPGFSVPQTTTTTTTTASTLLETLNCCMEMVISLYGSRSMKLLSLQTLLIFVNKVIHIVDEDSNNLPVYIRLELAQTVGKVFRHLEKVPFSHPGMSESEIRMYTDCFGSCLSYFSNMLLFARKQEDVRTIVAELYNILEDSKLIDSIVFQLRPYERCTTVTPKEFSAVLDLFSLMAVSGDSNMLSFLVFDEIVALLNEIIRAAATPSLSTNNMSSHQQRSHHHHHHYTIRGYQPTQSGILGGNGAARSGWQEDHRHINRTRVYQFLAVLLREVTETFSTTLPKDEKLKKRCFDRALYCLDSNRGAVRECLVHVSEATMVDTTGRSRGGTPRGFTIQLLREAAAIFALFTEVCVVECEVDLFRQKYPRLYEDLTMDSRRVVLSICSFLGASGISRALFLAIADLEKINGGSSLGRGETGVRLGFSPVIDVFLSSGRNNTRHEAIQFSHFVSGCSAAVSATERKNQLEFPSSWESPSSMATAFPVVQPVELTESSLEQNSRCAMTNKFSFSIEMEAAKCLCHAANTLWANHPATTSFVEFTPEEMAKVFQDISWIKERDIISYRVDDSNHWPWAGGEVEHVDTIKLCFHVRPVDGNDQPSGPILVPLHRLAGVEDRTKRRSILAFAPAPETSSDLHRSRGELSVGHLILAMRWCHEFAFEDEQQGLALSPWVRMNAQVLSLILAKEISLHRENKNIQRVAPDAVRMLKAQLLDLFGEKQELAVFLGASSSSAMREQGRLVGLIPDTLWKLVRDQLSSELKDAMQNSAGVQEVQKKSSTFEQALGQGGREPNLSF